MRSHKQRQFHKLEKFLGGTKEFFQDIGEMFNEVFTFKMFKEGSMGDKIVNILLVTVFAGIVLAVGGIVYKCSQVPADRKHLEEVASKNRQYNSQEQKRYTSKELLNKLKEFSRDEFPDVYIGLFGGYRAVKVWVYGTEYKVAYTSHPQTKNSYYDCLDVSFILKDGKKIVIHDKFYGNEISGITFDGSFEIGLSSLSPTAQKYYQQVFDGVKRAAMEKLIALKQKQNGGIYLQQEGKTAAYNSVLPPDQKMASTAYSSISKANFLKIQNPPAAIRFKAARQKLFS